MDPTSIPSDLPTVQDFRFDVTPMHRIEVFIKSRTALGHLATTRREIGAFAAAAQTTEHYMGLTA